MAGCSSCGTDCDDITLPTGDDGATGAAGQAGASILFNQAINVSTSTTSSEVLYTYTMSNPSPLDEAGDVLIIKSYWSTNVASTSYVTNPRVVKIKIGGNDINPNNTVTYPALGSNVQQVHYEVQLSRITATSAAVDIFIKYINPGGFIFAGLALHSPNINYSTAQTVPNLDSGAQTITFEADGTTIGDITLDRVIIEKLEKV